MISIIVPVFNEEESLKRFIPYIKEEIMGKDAEFIVIDGGSSDQTIDICMKNGVNVFVSPKKGRAAQMNFGSSMANGKVLYFLHADSFPPKNFIEVIHKNLDKENSAGCFRLSFTPNHFLLALYAWFTRFDVDLFRFGDQSLFVKKALFFEIEGFDEELLVMEDQQIVKDIKKEDSFVIMNGSIATSSRKYFEVGVLKLQIIFSVIVLLYYLGVRQETLSDFYKNQIR